MAIPRTCRRARRCRSTSHHPMRASCPPVRQPMRESLARFGTAGTALIFGSVAIWLLLLVVVPHLMLIDYAFHANPGSIDKGLASPGWTLHSFRPLFDPNDALAFNTFVRTL